MALRGILIAPLAFAVFAIVIGAALFAEAVGRLREGCSYEPGDGLGCEEDYL